MRKLTQEDLDDLNHLVQMGLIDVVSIDADGEPSYRLSLKYRVTIISEPARAPKVRGIAGLTRGDRSSAQAR